MCVCVWGGGGTGYIGIAVSVFVSMFLDFVQTVSSEPLSLL